MAGGPDDSKNRPRASGPPSAGRRKQDTAKRKSAIDHDLIRDLAKLLEETGLTEIEFERNGERVRVARRAKRAAGSGEPPPPRRRRRAPPLAEGPPDHSRNPGLVTSPMVGTAYLGAEPGARPYVEVGSRVRAGETLLIIEAMKTMNQIPAPRAGVGDPDSDRGRPAGRVRRAADDCGMSEWRSDSESGRKLSLFAAR